MSDSRGRRVHCSQFTSNWDRDERYARLARALLTGIRALAVGSWGQPT
jgi:hypothetical protein